jgi:hypothetical protein
MSMSDHRLAADRAQAQAEQDEQQRQDTHSPAGESDPGVLLAEATADELDALGMTPDAVPDEPPPPFDGDGGTSGTGQRVRS